MIESKMVTRYYVRCRMDISQPGYITGYASDEENLKELVASLKKTWRYVEPMSYQVRNTTPEHPATKRKKK